MARAQHTINPLHFEDLEPHRFEDLVRQLAYGFRAWRTLEATGRLGRDEGIDIRGVETITHLSASLDVDESDDTGDLPGVDEDGAIVEQHVWTIQCKRYKSLTPRQVRTFVNEALPKDQPVPYGLVLAAACDVSTEAMAAFREESINAGIMEYHFWTKARLEDMLFTPHNDHLLFAYIGVSLIPNRRITVQSFRRDLAVKRKVMRALKIDDIRESGIWHILVRDINDTDYPVIEEVPNFLLMDTPPWHTGSVEAFGIGGVLVWRFGYEGWIKEDGSWDMLESTKTSVGHPPGGPNDYWGKYFDNRWEDRQLVDRVPDGDKKAFIRECFKLPFASIVDIDPIGDPLHPIPQFLCSFDQEDGPYRADRIYLYGSGFDQGELDIKDRADLFSTLRNVIESNSLNEAIGGEVTDGEAADGEADMNIGQESAGNS